jgi:hypothetical protein
MSIKQLSHANVHGKNIDPLHRWDWLLLTSKFGLVAASSNQCCCWKSENAPRNDGGWYRLISCLCLRKLADASRLRAEEVPGFAVGVVEAGLGVAVAAEQEAGDTAGGSEGDEVPGVFGDDVGGEEVDFAG